MPRRSTSNLADLITVAWPLRRAARPSSVWAAALLYCCVLIGPVQSAPLAVTVVLSENSGPYLEFSDALREKLLKKNVYLDIVDDPDEIISEQGLVVAVGMKAAAAVAAGRARAALNVLVPESGYWKLLRDHPQRAISKTYSAIFLDQPPERQVRLIAALLPGRRQVGVLFDSFPPDELAQIRQRMTMRGLSLHEHKVGADFPLHIALQHVLDNSEVLLALPDAAIYNSSTIRNILLASYRSGDPVIGFSPAYVKAGALAAVFSTPAQIAEQSAQYILQYGETRTLPTAQHPQLYEIAVNEQVGRSLDLATRNAEELRQEISAVAGDAP